MGVRTKLFADCTTWTRSAHRVPLKRLFSADEDTDSFHNATKNGTAHFEEKGDESAISTASKAFSIVVLSGSTSC